MKTLGIVGGLGPETSANFYLDVVRRYREKVPSYPSILLYNVPLDKKVEDNIIRDSKEEALLLPYLLHAVDILSISSDVIALPCNTAHIFIEEMRERSRVPIIDMISETLEFAKSHNYNKLGLLATKKTIESGLYSERAEKLGISIVNPSEESNKQLSSAIHSFLQNGLKEEQQEAVLSAVSELVDEGVEAVILGCTDLKAILNKRSIDVPLVDSLCVLTDVAVRALSGGE